MSKLEIICELLVNELTDFEKDVNRLTESIAKAENLQVKFDTKPLEGLLDQLQALGKEEEVARMNYLRDFQQKLDGAKIYPSWAVISFSVMIALCCLLSFSIYKIKSEAQKNEKTAYANGEKAATEYINLYLRENPKALESYKKWAENQ